MTEPHTPPSGPDPLDTLEGIAACLAAAFDSGDAAAMAAALAGVTHSGGFPHLAAAAGVPRAQLAAAFEKGEMSLDTTLAIMKVIDLHLPADRH